MTCSAILGFPRIGARRELKTATEAFWKGQLDHAGLLAAAADLRARHWAAQKEAGGSTSSRPTIYPSMTKCWT